MKQKISYFIAIFLMAMLDVSCDNGVMLSDNENLQIAETIPYSNEDIIAKANYYYGMLPGHTRVAMPKVSAIQKVLGDVTRGEESPAYYIVNYEDEAGFVMVGGNEIADPVVALSDEGNLQLADTLTNPALGEFINSLSRTPVLKDSDLFKPLPIDPVYSDISVAPLLSANVRKWGDGEPFNKYAPIVNSVTGKRAKVGCVAVSCAMMMSYYKWPNVLAFASYDWDAINNEKCNDTLCLLLRNIGASSQLNTQYGEYETVSEVEEIKIDHMLRDYYTGINANNGTTLKNFDVSTRQKIMEQLPLLMWGDVVKNSRRITHTWVIDGLLYISPDDDQYIGISSPTYFMHCVWGNYGIGNGYYKLNRLDAIGGNRFSVDRGDGTYEGMNDKNESDKYSDTSYLFKFYKSYPIVP